MFGLYELFVSSVGFSEVHQTPDTVLCLSNNSGSQIHSDGDLVITTEATPCKVV